MADKSAIVKPNGEVVTMTTQDLRRIMSLAREGLRSKKAMNIRMTSTEVHVERLLLGRLGF